MKSTSPHNADSCGQDEKAKADGDGDRVEISPGITYSPNLLRPGVCSKPRKVTIEIKWAPVTEDVVLRVGERVARGLTIKQACLVENPPVSHESYESAIKTQPEWKRLHERQMALFVDRATEILWQGDAGPVRRTKSVLDLLERRHKQEWSRPAQVAIHNETTTNVLVAGIDSKGQQAIQERLNALAKLTTIPIETISETTHET